MMSESGKTSGPEMGNAATEADEPVNDMPVDGTPAGEQTESKKAGEENTVSSPQKKRFGPWLFLLLIFIGLPLAWFFSPPEMQQQADEVLTQFMAQVTPQHTSKQASTTLSANEPMTEIIQQPETTTKTTTPETEVVAASGKTAEPAASNQPPSQIENTVETDLSAAENMRQAIERLQYELTAVQAENHSLRGQIKARQKQTLGFLLRLLAQPQTRLAQHAELWNDIASLPINEERKSVALAMRDLANDNLILIRTWRQALSRLVENIPAAAQTDILPKPENQYFAWLTGTFHLHPASTESALMQTSLKQQLLDMEHNLSLGIWPEQNKWRALIAALHDQFGADADLGLPDAELLSPALREINLLPQTAVKWLEAL